MGKAELEAVIATLEKWSILFGVLVAIGVTGESVVGFRLWRRNDELKTIQEREIAGLADRAATANRRTAELQALIQPREMSDEQLREVTNRLKSLTGRSLLIGSHWNDVESARLARQIKAALNAAGIGLSNGNPDDQIGRYPEVPLGLFGGGVLSGVEIHTGIEVWGAHKEMLATVLRSACNLAVTTPEAQSPFEFSIPDLITVFVGVKPLTEVKPTSGPR